MPEVAPAGPPRCGRTSRSCTTTWRSSCRPPARPASRGRAAHRRRPRAPRPPPPTGSAAGQWLLALPPTHRRSAGARAVAAGGDDAGVLPPGPFEAGAFAEATARLTGPRRYVSLVPTQLRRLLPDPGALRAYDAVLLGGPPTRGAARARPRGRGAGGHDVRHVGDERRLRLRRRAARRRAGGGRGGRVRLGGPVVAAATGCGPTSRPRPSTATSSPPATSAGSTGEC